VDQDDRGAQVAAWYHLDGDRAIGPFDDAALDSLVRSGRVTDATLVSRDGAPWRPYGAVAGPAWAAPKPWPGPEAMRHDALPQLASFGRRLGAWAIDLALSGTIGALVLVLIDGFDSTTSTNDGFQFEVQVNARGTVGLLVISMLWYVIPHGLWGQTLGKLLVGVKVVRADEPTRTIGLGLSLGRWIVAQVLLALCILPGVVDHLFPLRDDRRQTLHDKAVNAVVIRAT
jgi:uncharacterized RDD family membrane protein YckC